MKFKKGDFLNCLDDPTHKTFKIQVADPEKYTVNVICATCGHGLTIPAKRIVKKK